MKRLFNDGWEFSLQPLHTGLAEIQNKKESFEPVGLPHDWLIYDVNHLYADGTGWYRRILSWEPKEEETLVFLRFDGVYMDSRIYVNGNQAGEWKYGYSAFEVELTPFLRAGENEILVSMDYQDPNSRWYSGAGIFRNVWLKEVPFCHLAADGVYFHAQKAEGTFWEVDIETEVEGGHAELDYMLLAEGRQVPLLNVRRECAHADGSCRHRFLAQVEDPVCWDVEHPYVYRLRTTLHRGEQTLDVAEQNVGFRTVVFSPEEGFLLNGRKVKLNGVCEHHDLGCLGSAFHVQAMRRKFRILKEMGVNAVRTSHNMPAAELLELADEMGILIVDEAFDMWEMPKTTYDYARFFPDWYQKDVASWVRRDRNHPCVIMWSMGNEIYDTHDGPHGLECMKRLLAEVLRHDPKGNARPTIGSNYMPWENTQKCADVLKLIGYNYAERCYDEHHAAHPDWIIYGSETASVVQSRGIYHFPYKESVLADEDEQCSALGNSTTGWGAKSPEACVIAERDHPYSCGQFLWTGFDYIGEPTPYHTKNSYFGQVDTAGFPKDSYYIYQSSWTDPHTKPMVHLFPYWDFNVGQQIDVRACTNAPSVELFFNGESMGVCAIDHAHGQELAGHWLIPYAPGELLAVARDEDGNEVARQTRHSFGDAARIVLKAEKESLSADGEDLLFLEISMEDADGYLVENANSRVTVTAEGAGALVGTDNGDSTDTESYKCGCRRLFSGKLLAVFKAGVTPGDLQIRVSSEGLSDAVLTVPVTDAAMREGVSPLAYLADVSGRKDLCGEQPREIPVRKILLSCDGSRQLNAEHREVTVKAELFPSNASDREVIWCVVDDKGIPLPIAEVQADGLTAHVTAKGDGAFRLRCMSRCGTDKPRIFSQLEFETQGLGQTYWNPYGFITGGLYDYSRGDVGNGNERGVATPSDPNGVFGYHGIDFGPRGSDEICLPIFALNDEPYRIRIYEGMAGEEGAELVGDVIYQKPSIWSVYQEETYRLNRKLKGVTSISFVTEKKIHLKGFFFKQSLTFERINAAECDAIYGDSFHKEPDQIRGIGNNVSIEFAQMDFGAEGAREITVCGNTPLEKNTIILNFVSDGQEKRQILEFIKGKNEQTFQIERLCGKGTVRFVFLPGSNFDFAWFRFAR